MGIYLLDKAQKEIKEINQKSLFEKAEIKKKYLDKSDENSKKIKEKFIRDYNNYLNDTLSSVLLDSKEKLLKLKDGMLKELKKGLIDIIEEKIEKNYAGYLDFLFEQVEQKCKELSTTSEDKIVFNSRDFNQYSEFKEKIDKLFRDTPQVQESHESFIGGFRFIHKEGEISYDYSIEKIIEKNIVLIQKEFLKSITDKEIKKIEYKFENKIQTYKDKIEGYLNQYERL